MSGTNENHPSLNCNRTENRVFRKSTSGNRLLRALQKHCETLQTHRKLHGLLQVCLCLKLRDGVCNLLSQCYFLLLPYFIDACDLMLCTLQFNSYRVPQSPSFSGTFFSCGSKRFIGIFRLAGKCDTSLFHNILTQLFLITVVSSGIFRDLFFVRWQNF